MKKITELTFNNTYRQLPDEFYHIVNPKPFENPFLICINPEMVAEIELEILGFNEIELAQYLSGKKLIPGCDPIALYYTGHQFGVYNPHIGDGRAILLGEVVNSGGDKWDLHLKGAGTTNYSRGFDGRAVLRSTIREYLCSEAMHHLGIPTTRALSIVGSDEKVERETTETGAMLIRMAKSHVRFGSFEGFYFRGFEENIKILTDYVIENNYPDFINKDGKYKLLANETAKRTGTLIAKWQAFGFTHGVMNTDNMSIIGDTIDYGPYGFMETFKNDYAPNHSDHFGRYSYKNQPSIAFWNLNKHFHALSCLLTNEDIQEALGEFREAYAENYLSLMTGKFGFKSFVDGDKKFIDDTLELLEENEIDFPIFFRELSNVTLDANVNTSLVNKTGTDWLERYKARLRSENSDGLKRKESMNLLNPKYILRTYIAEQAIHEAVENGNYSEIENVRKLLLRPFDEQPENEKYANEPPEWAKGIALSCSS